MHILSLHYLPCIEWFTVIHRHESIIDLHEHYLKQSYRNRCRILSANGPLSLVIPVKKDKVKETMRGMRIENDQPWRKQHWQAIRSAYRSSPYFEFYADEFEFFYLNEFEWLHEFNSGLIVLCLKLMKSDCVLKFSEAYLQPTLNDYRELIHPKKKTQGEFKPYLQVFAEKLPFEPNLSIIDLLFNKGGESLNYLR